MNSINVLLIPTLINDSDIFSNTIGHLRRCFQTLAFRRSFLAAYMVCFGLLFILAIDAHITMLCVSFACCGLWISKRLTSKSSAMVIPILVLLNLILWREAFLALPIAALTIAFAVRLPVNQNCRDLLNLSGIFGGSLAILLMFGNEIFQSLARF